MRTLSLLALTFLLARTGPGADSVSSPVLQWFRSVGVSGANVVTGVAADSAGNIYVAGNTTSPDFLAAPPAANPGANPPVDAPTHVFIAKLDSQGNVIYARQFGGSASDTAAGLAVGKDGSVYVTGATRSRDFPVTSGAYATVFPANPMYLPGANFVLKLHPDGSLAWSSFFADTKSTANAVAVDSDGNAYIAGVTGGQLPTTPGAYQTQFRPAPPCGLFVCLPSTAAFLTKFNATGSALLFSTYIANDLHNDVITTATAIALDPAGNVYLAGAQTIYLINATGTTLVASNVQPAVTFQAVTVDANINVYATGLTITGAPFPATPGAFQGSPYPAPSLPGQSPPGGLSDAFAMKFDMGLSQLLAATLLGGDKIDVGESVALDPAGNVIVSGYTDSKTFPTLTPFQVSFSEHSGFVAGLDSDLSHLLFSTYAGDTRAFEARGAFSDGSGNLLLAGSTLTPGGPFLGGEPGASFVPGGTVFVNKIALPPASAPRLDAIVNFASRAAGALSPGETITALGSGFAPHAQLLLNGKPIAVLLESENSIVAVIPDDETTSGAVAVTVAVDGTKSNTVLMPAAPASPGIYSVDGSGVGQGYILNSDGALNSPANPASEGSAITIFATGVGHFKDVGPYTVTGLTVNIFIDGFFARGIAAVTRPVTGLPGYIYQISVYVPHPAGLASQNPDLIGFKMPPQVPVRMVLGTVNSSNPDNSVLRSQDGIALSVK